MLHRRASIFAALIHSLAFSVHAHGDLHERIQFLTQQIATNASNPTLLIQRAELFRQHQQFDAALLDLATAARAHADERAIHLAQAQVFSDAGQTTNALDAVEKFLARETNHSGALVIRARCRFKLNQPQAAVADYTQALHAIKTPEPDLYLDRARSQAALGQLAAAANGLDEGLARLGEIPALALAAIEYDRQRADFDAALARVDRLLIPAPVKEPWLVLRAEILAQAGRLAEARDAFQQSLGGIEKYPPVRRGLEQTIQLQSRAREGLAHVEARLAKQSKA
ncbi:MAG: hypothetical protein RLY20_3055 [Verrucomicrobiota bacterium]|jgi:tetratricopeptide (TPR) repeat protein